MKSLIRLITISFMISIASAEWTTESQDGIMTAVFGGIPQITYQSQPLAVEKAPRAFLPSAFIHPFKTPSGFECSTVRPNDHIHHLGLWWPWKFIEFKGKKYNCWEIQQGEGAHVAQNAKIISSDADGLEWHIENEIRVRKTDPSAGPPARDGIPVIKETVRLRAQRHNKDANIFDFEIHQTAISQPVRILNYRYSGFCWRGPKSWNAKNSVMTTNQARNREQANGSEASWVLVTGPAHHESTASVLMMSAAVQLAGHPERLRVWNALAHGGTPFVNFNPVQKKPLPLDLDHPAVSRRIYRVIAADGTLTAQDADAHWHAWLNLLNQNAK